MGWAKYTEDNIEIALERLSQMKSKKEDASRRFEGRYPVNSSRHNTKITYMDIPTEVRKETAAAPIQPARKPAATATIKPVKPKNKRIVCQLCGKKFLFSGNEQLYFEKKGWDPPKRCPDCRVKWKAMREKKH